MNDDLQNNPGAWAPTAADDLEHEPFDVDCWHIAIVSVSPTECQCVDCLRIWPKRPDFKSDFPSMDRG